jgi:hypothetical protein
VRVSVQHATIALFHYCRRENWSGYDSSDVLISRVLTSIGRSKGYANSSAARDAVKCVRGFLTVAASRLGLGKRSFPVAESVPEELTSLPMYDAELRREAIGLVCRSLVESVQTAVRA